jgi:P21-Rho-binding domain.
MPARLHGISVNMCHLTLYAFGCLCVQRKRVRQQARRIDRSMIGSPTNFQHTGHIGSGDVDMGNSHLRAIQNQMQSKGGYETAFTTVKVNE